MKYLERLETTWPNLIWQPLAAILVMCVVLFFLNLLATSVILWAVGAGSIASSCFVVFARPGGGTAEPKKIIGGYLVSIITGEIISLLFSHVPFFSGSIHGGANIYALGCLAAVSMGLAIFFMSLFRFEHPPATGLALVLVLDIRDYRTLVVIFLSAVMLALIRIILNKCLCDLL